MKIIIKEYWCIPEEASGTNIYPIEYESIEKLMDLFEKENKKARSQNKYEFTFFGKEFQVCKSKLYFPQFFTLENWFHDFNLTR